MVSPMVLLVPPNTKDIMINRHKHKELISADGVPYTAWQLRTRLLCILLMIWAVVEIAVGAGFITLRAGGIFDLADYLGNITVGPATIISGAINAVVAAAGLYGAHNPRRITLFFWAVFLDALLNAWQVASLLSSGAVEPASVFSLVISLAYAVCAWNVRGQTGYFDNHPHPGDPDELPLEHLAEEVAEKRAKTRQ